MIAVVEVQWQWQWENGVTWIVSDLEVETEGVEVWHLGTVEEVEDRSVCGSGLGVVGGWSHRMEIRSNEWTRNKREITI